MNVVDDPLGTRHVHARNAAAWGRHLGRPADPALLGSELSSGTLPAAIAAVAASAPDRPALTVGDESVTHGELEQRAGETAGWLRQRGLAVGDGVLLAVPTSIDLVVGYLACLRLGARVTFVSPTATADELRQLAERSSANATIAGDEAFTVLRRRVPVTVCASPWQSPSLDDARGTPPVAPVPSTSDDVAIVAFTSGTTGRPKAVPLTHANLLASIRAALIAWRWNAQDVLVHALPLFHQHGLSGVHATLLAGSRAVILPQFDPGALCAAVEREKATVLFAVPTIWERLVASMSFSSADLSCLRLPTSGSAPLSPGLAARVAAVLGEPPLERYGLTETGFDVSNLYEGRRRPGAVGLPLPGLEMAIADADGAPVADGEDGEIVLRGPQVFGGYEGADASASAFLPGGWFRTGDVGRIDPGDGYLTITGRLKDLIITGGINVYPREIELLLEELPGVARAAVVGAPSTQWGEEVVAFVVPEEGADLEAEALKAATRQRLSSYKCPKRLFLVDHLPATHMGKVRRDELVHRAAGQP